MNKKLLTIAVAAAMAAPLAAQAADGPVVYGQVHAAVEHVDFDQSGADAENPENGDYWRVMSRQSRLGVKGDEDLGGGLKAIYKLEFQVDIDDNAGDNQAPDSIDNVTARDQYVGLAGSWGSFLLGRHDTPYKFMTISRDKFNTTLGDWNEVGFYNRGTNAAQDGLADDVRANNAIMYTSPNFNGLTAAALVSPGERSDDDDGIADEYMSFGAKYENGPLYVGAGYEEMEFQGDEVSGTNEDEDKWRLVASYQIGDFNVGGMYEDIDNLDGVEDDEAQIWQLNASYTFGNTVAKVAYQEGEAEDDSTNQDPEYDTWTLGVDHNLSKRTRAYAVYTKTDTNSDAVANAAIAGNSDDWDAFGVGLIHNF